MSPTKPRTSPAAPSSPDARERARDLRLQRLFGITAAEYDRILAFQGGHCAICSRLPGKTRLAVDHDHTTGLTRGLVCWQCNSGLQKFRDNAELLTNATEYIKNPPVTAALGEQRFGRTGRVTTKTKRRRKNVRR